MGFYILKSGNAQFLNQTNIVVQSRMNIENSFEDENMDQYTIVGDHSQKTSSLVWKYFGNLKKNDQLYDLKHVYCTKCFEESKTKKYQRSTSTGNLIKHLKKAHNIMDQPSYRIKKYKDSIIVTKEEPTTYYEDEAEYYRKYNRPGDSNNYFYIFLYFVIVDGSSNANYIPLPGSQDKDDDPSRAKSIGDLSENNEYIAHGLLYTF